jgi:hypothetical protein
MPFKSKAQERYLWAKKPKIAKEFADKTEHEEDLPEKVGKKYVENFKKSIKRK